MPVLKKPGSKLKKPKKPTPIEVSGVSKIEMTGVERMNAVIAAMQAYFLYPTLTLRSVWENFTVDLEDPESTPIREAVKYRTIELRASRGNWQERRKEHWRQIENRILAKLQSDMVEREAAEIKKLDKLTGVAESYIYGVRDPNDPDAWLIAPVRPRSMEGVVGALAKIDERMSIKRRFVADALKTAASPDPSEITDARSLTATVPDDSLSDEEINEITRRIVAKRAET